MNPKTKNSILNRPHSNNKLYKKIIERQKRVKGHYRNKKIGVWINTYNRPEYLDLLLTDIIRDKEEFQIVVFIFDDASEVSYADVINKHKENIQIVYERQEKNHGKFLYWELCTKAIKKICSNKFKIDYVIKMDDDGRLVDRFFYKLINVWDSINDLKKACLNFRVDSREGNCVWTKITPKLITKWRYPVYVSQWVDMDFICSRDMFCMLRFRITPQPESRWEYSSSKSSGTGEDISKRLVKKGLYLYMTTETLVMHDEHESIMNKEERKKNPLITKEPNEEYGL